MHDNDMPKTNPLVKVCGLTSEEQALQVARLGANAIGIISVEESPRYVSAEIKKKIKYLKLTKKKFEFRGQKDERRLYDDYAHHPNEIKETIKLGRLFIKQKKNNEFQKNRLVALFQPHRYSRVKQFNKEFAEELSKADVIYVTSIYGAGEGNKNKITSKIITDLIYKKNKNVSYISNYYEVTKNFYELTQKGDLILNMGAGDCHNFWSILNEKNNYD